MPTPALVRAQRVAEAAFASAANDNCNITVVVVDATGAPVLVMRDGAGWLTPDVARAKAATAARMECPSGDLEAKRATYPAWWEQLVRRFPEATTLGGGFPLVVDGELVGAVGVSGGTVDQDIVFAMAGAAAV